MAVTIHAPGGPDALVYEPTPVADPDEGPGSAATIRGSGSTISTSRSVAPAGPIESFPAVLGMEAAGTIEAVGTGVIGFAPGDRVSYCMVLGSYAERRVIDADRLIALPPEISEETAAAATLQGLTAQYLLRSSYAVQPGDHDPDPRRGGRHGPAAVPVGETPGRHRHRHRRQSGQGHPCRRARLRSYDRLHRGGLPGPGDGDHRRGRGVSAVYDAVGRTTFEGGSCLPFPNAATWSPTATPPARSPPLDIATLSARSLTVTRGSLGSYVKDPVDRAARAAELWSLIADGTVKVAINQRYPLAEDRQGTRRSSGAQDDGLDGADPLGHARHMGRPACPADTGVVQTFPG